MFNSELGDQLNFPDHGGGFQGMLAGYIRSFFFF
jgi:hypothetical protein